MDPDRGGAGRLVSTESLVQRDSLSVLEHQNVLNQTRKKKYGSQEPIHSHDWTNGGMLDATPYSSHVKGVARL